MMMHAEDMATHSGYHSPSTSQATLVVLEQGDLDASSLPSDLDVSVAVAANWLGVQQMSLQGPCCVLIDFDSESDDTVRQLAELHEHWLRITCIACASDTSINNVVRAMRIGCVDFISKPIRPDALLAACNHAFRIDAAGEHSPSQFRARRSRLTDRELEVLKLFVNGQNTKMIAKQLGVSYQTIDKHRNRALKKMHVASLIELTRVLNGEAFCQA